MKKRKNSIIFLIILFMSITTVVFICFKKQKYPNIKVAYIYENEMQDNYYQYYEQSLLGNLFLSKIDISKEILDLSTFDLVFPDLSITKSKDLDSIKSTLENYISSGGSVLTTFQTKDLLSNNAYGGGNFVEIPFTTDLKYQENLNNDYIFIQEIMKDYTDTVSLFQDYETVKNHTNIYALDNTKALGIVSTKDDLGIITESKFGKGNVYYLGGILPTNIFNTSFDLNSNTSKLNYFNDTANASNHLLFTEIASLVSKNKLGFSVKRVFGSNGRPSIAHQNHFEVLSAVKKGSMEKWIEMCEENNQITSYSLAVGMYEWYSRFESIGYALNKSDNDLDFTGNRINNFYAWGTHPVVDNKWLNINKSDENVSYFIDTKLPTRAYPFVFDFNNDGAMDIISGSLDGFFHVYKGMYNDINNEWKLENSSYLKTSAGENLSVSSHSSPTIIDFDNDGVLDLISGSNDGNIYFFKGVGPLNFLDKQILIKYEGDENEYKLSAPDISDINNDGILDIICGYGNGDIYIYDGAKNFSRTFLANVGNYPAPRTVDFNKDGRLDIAVGVQSGYIAKLIQNENGFYDDGFINESEYYNNKGNTNLKSGNNIVPFFVDLDKNGTLDLVCGLLEYGEFAVNISDKNFPYKEELKNGIEFAKEHFVPIIPHVYTHAYKISDEEIQSLSDHKSAFELYGLDWENTGVNQHTWFTSSQTPNQTLKNEYESGLAWNFGYRPANSPALPGDYAEYKIITPFYLKLDDKKTMLLYNANFKHEDELFKTSAKYDLPVTVYRHSEYDTTQKPELMLEHIKSVNDFKEKYNYNFVTENQMAMAISAAYNTDIVVEYRPIIKFLNNLEDFFPKIDLYVSRAKTIKNDNLWNDDYNSAVGFEIELANRFLAPYTHTDASVQYRKDDSLFLGLKKPAHIWTSKNNDANVEHLINVNLPADILESKNEISISFLDDGLQQASFYSTTPITFKGDGFKMLYDKSKSLYTFTKTGTRSKLIIENRLRSK